MNNEQKLIIDSYNKTNEFGRILGMVFDVISPGSIKIKMKITDLHLATINVAHGGAVAALMDATLGVAALSLTAEKEKVVSTVDLNMSFMRPVKLNDTLHASGNVIKAGNRILFSEAIILNQNNELVSKGSGTFNAYPVEKIIPQQT